MRNFFAKIRKLLKPSRRWQVMNAAFQWKTTCLSFIFTAAMLAWVLPAYAASPQAPATTIAPSQEDAYDAEVFFRREKEARVPIIMYHLVTENSRYVGKYGIRPSQLEEDLKYLKENGYNTVVMQDLINFVENGKRLPKNPIVLTFDDGNSSDYKYLFPLLKEYDMKAVISIIGSATDKYTPQQEKNPTAKFPNLTWPQVKEMHDSGLVEVQSHGYDVHGSAGSGKLKRESAETYHGRLAADLTKLQDLCEEHLGEKPSTFCYPLGIISKGSHAVLEELGFVASLSCQEGINIIRFEEKESLLKLNRNNRPSGRSIEEVLKDILRKAS